MKNARFYICPHCGNIVEMVNDAGVKPFCCGQKMERLVPGSVDASAEKHVPAVTVDGNLVKVVVGSVVHPMAEEHHIAWIALETERDAYIHWLKPGEAPNVSFLLNGENPLTVYAYCNLHGLWKRELN